MDVARVQTVSVGMPRERSWARVGRTSIEKRPVQGPVRVDLLGLEGDQASDTEHHGGVDQAIYAYSRTELDWWERELGRPIRDGGFGENLTVAGYEVDDAVVGERWAIGSTLLEVCYARIPCRTFQEWQRECGYDDAGWLKRYTEHRRTGAYLRVLEGGTLSAGDPIDVVRRPDHGITVSTMFVAMTLQRDLLPSLLAIDGLAAKARRKAESYLVANAG